MHSDNIENVAIYLRKSRASEDEDDLKNHRVVLTDYAKSKGWHYKIYEEGIASSDTLAGRPVINEMLVDIQNNLFDYVLVMDADRLSRGNMAEQGYIFNTLRDSETKLATRDKIFDLENRSDDMVVGIQSVFARDELRVITDRLTQGKKTGAKLGRFTNGKPPFPYEYDKNTKSVIVNENKKKVYRMIIEKYLTGKSGTQNIAVWLNNQNIKSPNNSVWHNQTIKRILIDEFHMGVITYGKNKWGKNATGKRFIKSTRDKTEWNQGMGTHEKLKTPEEHERILRILTTNNKIPRKSRAGSFPTTGLMYCSKCGKRMSYSVDNKINKKTGKRDTYTKCGKEDPYGNRCPQRGIKMTSDFYDALYQTILNNNLSNNHIKEIYEDDNEKQELNNLLDTKLNDLEKAKSALERVTMAFESGAYDLDYFIERKKIYDDIIASLNKEINEIQSQLKNIMKYSEEEIQALIQSFKDNWYKANTPKEQNQLLKSIIHRIDYNREGDTITFEIEYN